MDLAAQRVNSLAQRILPDRPHHLSLSHSSRYPVPPDFWQHHSNLQYSTFISDTDRGILLTRPYYEIWEESETFAPSPANAAPRQEAKKTVTKMSFKDYQNSKKKLSSSPPDSGPLPRLEAKQSSAEALRIAKAAARPVDSKRKAAEVLASTDSTPLEDAIKRSRITSRDTSRNGRSPSPNTRRRSPDLPQSARPYKKPRIENATRPDTARTPKLESGTSKNLAGSVERSAHKDIAKNGGHALSNGRSLPGTHKVASPQRLTSNGLKSGIGGGSSNVNRTESSGKPAVPPLLSPLRLSLDDDQEGKVKGPAKRPAELNAQTKVSGKGDKGEAAAQKKHTRPSIPPLLSPTLPDIVEQELARTKGTPSKSDSNIAESRAADSPSSARKGLPKAEVEEERPRTLIVDLKYKKKNAVWVQRLLALQPASKIEALKKERSVSAEVNTPPAKKRPRASLDSILVSKPPAPSTPLKTATAMSRAASSNSQAQTPGDTTGLTPGAGDRPSTSHDSESMKSSSSISLRRKGTDYTTLGTQLKHKRDGILRPNGGAPKADGLSSADRRRVAALSLEMVLSYMAAFDTMNQARQLDRKAGDFHHWESLLPHLGELRNFTRSFRALDGLALQLHAIVLEELIRVYYHHDLTTVGAKLARYGKKIHDIWVEAHSCVSNINESSMKADLGPWSKPLGAAAAALHVLRRWTDREGVEWRPLLSLPLSNGA